MRNNPDIHVGVTSSAGNKKSVPLIALIHAEWIFFQQDVRVFHLDTCLIFQ